MKMTEAIKFITHASDPTDEAPYRIFADWLQQQGRTLWAELILVDLALNHIGENATVQRLRQRRGTLIGQLQGDQKGQLEPWEGVLMGEVCWRWGMPEHLVVRPWERDRPYDFGAVGYASRCPLVRGVTVIQSIHLDHVARFTDQMSRTLWAVSEIPTLEFLILLGGRMDGNTMPYPTPQLAAMTGLRSLGIVGTESYMALPDNTGIPLYGFPTQPQREADARRNLLLGRLERLAYVMGEVTAYRVRQSIEPVGNDPSGYCLPQLWKSITMGPCNPALAVALPEEDIVAMPPEVIQPIAKPPTGLVHYGHTGAQMLAITDDRVSPVADVLQSERTSPCTFRSGRVRREPGTSLLLRLRTQRKTVGEWLAERLPPR